jgi:hypothetical protein
MKALYHDAVTANRLAIAADERTRTVILRTTPALNEEIRRLVEMLEVLATERKK